MATLSLGPSPIGAGRGLGRKGHPCYFTPYALQLYSTFLMRLSFHVFLNTPLRVIQFECFLFLKLQGSSMNLFKLPWLSKNSPARNWIISGQTSC